MTRPAAFLDVTLPLGRRLDLSARGHFAEQACGLGVGVALRFGS